MKAIMRLALLLGVLVWALPAQAQVSCESNTSSECGGTGTGSVGAGSITATELAADSVTEAKLKAVDAAADEECLTYEATVGDFEWQACGSGTSLPVADTQTIIKGSVDATKLVRFEVDGLTTGTTRVVTVPDADITIAGINLAQTWTAAQQFAAGTAAAPSMAIGASNRGLYDTGSSVGISYGGALAFFANGSYAAVPAGTAFSPDNGGNLWVVRSQKTPDAPTFETTGTSNSIHINETGDWNYDFQNGPCGTSTCTNPTLIIHSAAQSTTEYMALGYGTYGPTFTKAATDTAFDFYSGATRQYSLYSFGIYSYSDAASNLTFGASSDTILTRDIAAYFKTNGGFSFAEVTAPAAPAANGARLYAKDNGAGKTQLCAIFSSGAEQCFATQP